MAHVPHEPALTGHLDTAAELLTAAAAQVPVESALAAQDSLTTATTLAHQTGGTMGDHFAHDLAELTTEVHHLLTTLLTLRNALLAAAATLTRQITPQPAAVSRRPSTAPGRPISRAHAQQLLNQLPPPVPKPNLEGKKTHGRWLDEHGRVRSIVSGRDEDATEAWRILRDRGIPLKAPPDRVSDVEQKLAARMVREGRRELHVVINNRPCRGRWSCNELVPVILPEGYSLTVYGPNYKKTFTGGARPW